MTWTEFKAAVLAGMTTEGTRYGVDTLRNMLIHGGTRDLQEKVPYYQGAIQLVLDPDDFVEEGSASVGTIPDGAVLRDCYYVRRLSPAAATVAGLISATDTVTFTAATGGVEYNAATITLAFGAELAVEWTAGTKTLAITITDATPASDVVDAVNDEGTFTAELTDGDGTGLATEVTLETAGGAAAAAYVARFPLRFTWPWDRRMELVEGDVSLADQNAVAALDPYLRAFYVYPAVADGVDVSGTPCDHTVELNYDGIVDWANYEEAEADLRLDEDAALCVAHYARGQLLRQIDPEEAERVLAEHARLRLRLYLRHHGRAIRS